ncbi:bactofilin family protein [Kineothrix sp. MB12-C1]|uniref:bactofilin family protein n=1 Tax=Kineothrix sp. MB12-C1 TaxID=3070215 RepID=UPI0027D294D5|nr:polymer-forming cytoskeletal protein [Kineothrix sp. MB12-C1]WMC93100.1 polymer-forming cytoskeletal protein [Kineothrix sp. MB12-C1]
MLGKKQEHLNAKISSIVGADMIMEGNITAKETIRIEGTVKGDVSSEGIVIVSPTGTINGNVKGSSIMVAGTIKGDMNSGGRIEVSATGKIDGNIKTRSLIIDENAVFQGQCTMNTQDIESELIAAEIPETEV